MKFLAVTLFLVVKHVSELYHFTKTPHFRWHTFDWCVRKAFEDIHPLRGRFGKFFLKNSHKISCTFESLSKTNVSKPAMYTVVPFLTGPSFALSDFLKHLETLSPPPFLFESITYLSNCLVCLNLCYMSAPSWSRIT